MHEYARRREAYEEAWGEKRRRGIGRSPPTLRHSAFVDELRSRRQLDEATARAESDAARVESDAAAIAAADATMRALVAPPHMSEHVVRRVCSAPHPAATNLPRSGSAPVLATCRRPFSLQPRPPSLATSQSLAGLMDERRCLRSPGTAGRNSPGRRRVMSASPLTGTRLLATRPAQWPSGVDTSLSGATKQRPARSATASVLSVPRAAGATGAGTASRRAAARSAPMRHSYSQPCLGAPRRCPWSRGARSPRIPPSCCALGTIVDARWAPRPSTNTQTRRRASLDELHAWDLWEN